MGDTSDIWHYASAAAEWSMVLPPNWGSSGSRVYGDYWHICYLPLEHCGLIHIHTDNFRHRGGIGAEAWLDRTPVLEQAGVWFGDGGEVEGGYMDLVYWPRC